VQAVPRLESEGGQGSGPDWREGDMPGEFACPDATRRLSGTHESLDERSVL